MRRTIAGMQPAAPPQTAVPGVAPNYAMAGGAAAAPSPQMAAQRKAFAGYDSRANSILNSGGKQGLINYGGMVGGNADAIHALDSGAGHMI